MKDHFHFCRTPDIYQILKDIGPSEGVYHEPILEEIPLPSEVRQFYF